MTAKKVADVLVDILVAAGVKNITLPKPGVEKIP